MLYGIVRTHLTDFLATVDTRTDGAGLPAFVVVEFRKFLRCGVPAHGFARVRCEDCAFERLVPFRCKGRGFCPSMLHDPARHEALIDTPWDADASQRAIDHIVRDTERRFAPGAWWPPHARDLDAGDDPRTPSFPLYWGATGVLWALRYLRDIGAVAQIDARFDDPSLLDQLLARDRAWLAAMSPDQDERASFLMGDTPILLMAQAQAPTPERADQLAALIEGNLDHPARELMWGSPGTMLAALFLHRRFGDHEARWADLFRRSAARLWSQLEHPPEHGCRYWTQDLYGQRSNYIDAVHGFAGTAGVLLRGRDLLDAADWAGWQEAIATTVAHTATREDGAANWRPWLLHESRGAVPMLMLMQYCHGAPGFVILLADWPDAALDALMLEAGEAIWRAGPLAKGSNLCHGSGGNGYAFLKLYERTRDARWLARARAFAMHGILQMHADERTHGQLRYSLWTGDAGLAIYLWDCLRERAAFPTVDLFC